MTLAPPRASHDLQARPHELDAARSLTIEHATQDINWRQVADSLLDQPDFKSALGEGIRELDGCVIDTVAQRPPYYLAVVTIQTSEGDRQDPRLDAGLREMAMWGGYGSFADNIRIVLVDERTLFDLTCTRCLGWNPAGLNRRRNRPVIVAGAIAYLPWRRRLDVMAADLHTALERAKTGRLPGKGNVYVHISDGEIAAMGLDPHPKLSAAPQPVYQPVAA